MRPMSCTKMGRLSLDTVVAPRGLLFQGMVLPPRAAGGGGSHVLTGFQVDLVVIRWPPGLGGCVF